LNNGIPRILIFSIHFLAIACTIIATCICMLDTK